MPLDQQVPLITSLVASNDRLDQKTNARKCLWRYHQRETYCIRNQTVTQIIEITLKTCPSSVRHVRQLVHTMNRRQTSTSSPTLKLRINIDILVSAGIGEHQHWAEDDGLEEPVVYEGYICKRCQLIQHLELRVAELEEELADLRCNRELADLAQVSFREIVCTPKVAQEEIPDQTGRNRKRGQIMRDIQTYESLREDVPKPRILLIGQISAGKSSFFNSINSVFRGYLIHQAESGMETSSLSKKYKSYPIFYGRRGMELPLILCDTMGLEEGIQNSGILAEDILSVIEGHVTHDYTFNPLNAISKFDIRFRKNPKLADKVHCVVYVIDASSPLEMKPCVLKKLNAIRLKVNELEIPQLVLLTKVDLACIEVQKDVHNVYKSSYIKERMERLEKELGVPVARIIAVKNYSSELELSDAIDVLLLGALQQMLRAADSYFENLNLNERLTVTPNDMNSMLFP
ncbi:IF44L protein, partial [Polypterus senegalus]